MPKRSVLKPETIQRVESGETRILVLEYFKEDNKVATPTEPVQLALMSNLKVKSMVKHENRFIYEIPDDGLQLEKFISVAFDRDANHPVKFEQWRSMPKFDSYRVVYGELPEVYEGTDGEKSHGCEKDPFIVKF